ncbi:MAG: trypsin-like serine peptidase [Tabrizicola sp.]
MRHLFPGLLVAGLALWGGIGTVAPALSEDAGMVRLQTADDSRGWDAVGKLILGDRGFCTGALIGPQLVLTAAHCLYDKTTGVQLRPEEIEFQAGFRNGRAVAYRRVSRAVAHPDYRYGAADKLDRVTDDVALLELSQPIRLPSLSPFETGAAPVEGDAVDVVSYAQYREEAPSIQEACEVLAGRRDALILTCNVDFGSSGAPVFSVRDGVARVVSVISAKAEVDGRKVALAVPLAEPLATLRSALEESKAGSSAGGGSARILSGGTGSGAKFVRP